MPVGSLEQSIRKPSALETTLSSKDSTLESRLSGNDIPKMELLKINYVNQCKQAVSATRSSPGSRTSAGAVPQQQIETADPSRVYRYLAYKRPSSHPEISRKDTPETRDSPHYESWDFLQNKRAIQSRQPKECEDCRDCCCSECSDCSSTTADSLCCSPAVEKSHSWNYRTRLAAAKKEEVETKPRAERYAKIDTVDCVHDVVQMRHQRKPHKPVATKSCSDVSKIQQMFESAVQQRGHMAGHRESLDFEPLRKANARQADSPRRRTFSPAGSDERIKRLQPYDSDCCECRGHRKSLSDLKQLSKVPKKSEAKTECNEPVSQQKKKMAELKAQFEPKELPNRQFKRCHDWKPHSDSSAPAKNVVDLKAQAARKESPSRQFKKASETKTKNDQINRNERSEKLADARPQADPKDRHSRQGQRIEDSSKSQSETKELISWQLKKTAEKKAAKEPGERPRNESNEQFNQQIKKMFQVAQETPPIRNRSHSENQRDESSPSSDIELPQLIDSKMLRKRSDKRSSHHQIKVERVHIRKKRQPLLIINQLSETAHSHEHSNASEGGHEKLPNTHIAEADQKVRNTCGYKNCTFSNCPMSASEPQKIMDCDNDRSGKEHLVKENNMRNLEKCAPHSPDKIISTSPPTDKKKLSSVEDHRLKDQITIVVNRSQQSDPNDVQNFSNKNITKATTDELLAPSVLNNTIIIRSSSKAKVSNVDVNLKNIENRKFNDLKNINQWVDGDHGDHHRSAQADDHLRNSVKIFVRNYPVSTSTSSSADSNSLSDPDDRGRRRILRYDSQQMASGSSRVTLSSSSTADDDDDDEEEDDDDDGTGSALSADLRKYQSDGSSNCSSTVTVSSSTPATVQNVFPPTKFGCDGGIFWNNCYFYDADKSNYCCSAISCEDDNCPYYDLEEDDLRRGPVQTDQVDGCRREKGHAQKPATHKRIPRKTDVIHDMRPRSMDGVVDSGVSLNGDTGSSPDSEHMQNQQDSEARRLKRGHVLSELLETERIYVTEMSSILKGYCDQMQSEEMMHLVPASLQGKEDILFGNLHELYTFHSDIFLKDLENCISTTELVALCFVQRRDTFYRLYSFYCQNIPRSERLRETLVDTHLFLQECQKRLGHKLPLAAYLLKPVQRITKYQLLLKDLLRFSDSGSCTKELQKALDCMLIVLKCVNDSMHQIAITGFPSDLAQQGELLLQDSFQVWTESKKDIRLRIKPQQRHIFLYQKSMLFCKQTSKTGHNKSTYQFKHYVKTSLIGLTESVRGDPKRFEVWLQGRQEVHTMQAPTLEVKNKWVAEIKRVLLNQLEELKGEKIKQYGLNHRGLRQTASWDTPNSIILPPQRTMSCEVSSESNRNSNCSSDDSCPPHTPGVSSISSTEKENPDGCGWSSDYSNSEDEMSMIEDNSTPGSRFIALADYNAMGHSEVSMREGDAVELLKVGCAGWWFVRILDANSEGWTPAAYLESINRKSSRSSSRNQE